MSDTLTLHPADNVAVVTRRVEAGDDPLGFGPLGRALSAGHKLARVAVAKGDPVLKFGQVIGAATADIAPGDHVHTHNCAFSDHDRGYDIGADMAAAQAAVPEVTPAQFMGYQRADGRVGTRNFLALCATVNCSATVINRAAEELTRDGTLDAYPNVDGIAAFAHGTGCGMAATGRGADILERVLWGYATHPNVGAAVFVGLGCEVMQIGRMQARHGAAAPGQIHALTIQDTGGTRATIDAIKAHVREILPAANAVRRTPCPVSALTIALQCGGSDGLSGITANPALGAASNLIVGQGGSVILSETPEIYGAEGLLLRRSDPETADRLLACLKWWEDYTEANGGNMDNNPSPGNKQGGITTILEKSLGAVAKAGATPLRGFYDYAARIDGPGLVYMDTPGYDPVSVTGQIAGGAQIVVFTTGRGSAFGSKPAPTLKLATNDRLFETMRDDMDIGCGDIVSQGTEIPAKGREIYEAVLRVASGEVTKSEALGLGAHEFVPWQIGAVM